MLAGLAALLIFATGCPPQDGDQPPSGTPGDGSVQPGDGTTGGSTPPDDALTPPTFVEVSVVGDLVVAEAGNVAVAAVVDDTDGTVISVAANLADIGGPANQPLSFDSTTGQWVADVTVTPTVGGSRRVTFLATDDAGLTAEATTTIPVTGATTNQPPELANPDLTGALVVGVVNTIFVSIVASDPDGQVVSVLVDLSEVGGNPSQAMVPAEQSTWEFTGQVAPRSPGVKTVVFVATDDLGATSTAMLTVDVAEPSGTTQP